MANGVLIVAEHRDGKLKKITYELLNTGAKIATSLGVPLEAAVLGESVSEIAGSIKQFGASRIYTAESPLLSDYTPEGYKTVLKGIIENNDIKVVLIGATPTGKDLAPRLAASLKTGLASDCIGLTVSENGRIVFTRPIYAGKAITTMICESDPQMATLRPNVFSSEKPDYAGEGEIVSIEVDIDGIKAKVVEVVKPEVSKLDVTEADIVISGGRAMKDKDNFAIIEEIADLMGAAVGASRAAVDAGWIEHARQVGQTGKTVSPKLYIACGISGAIQHLAGMLSSKCIVAINKDPDAAIFKVADYGIVGDIYEILPLLKEELVKLRKD